MTDVKELLRTAIGSGQPRLPEVETIVWRAEARRRRERLIALSLAVALTAGLTIGLVALVRGDGGRPAGGVEVVGPTRAVYIPSESMTPTLRVGDTVMVDEGAYRSSGGLPAPGDLIAFDLGGATPSAAVATPFVKRVIGLPGDVVEERAGTMFVNGTEVPMPGGDDHRALGPWTVEPGHVFVVGDNLINSNDSRYNLGQVPLEQIIGKVVEILSPGDRRATIQPPPAGSAPGPGSNG